MPGYSVTHIALRVYPLREAESYYCGLFGLAVAFRETKIGDTWRSLPEGANWDDAEAAGISLTLVMLYRDRFNLALEAKTDVESGGRLSHLGLRVDADEINRIRHAAPTCGCRVLLDRPAIVIFEDRYDVRWEVTTESFDDPRQQSNGATHGYWLDLRKLLCRRTVVAGFVE